MKMVILYVMFILIGPCCVMLGNFKRLEVETLAKPTCSPAARAALALSLIFQLQFARAGGCREAAAGLGNVYSLANLYGSAYHLTGRCAALSTFPTVRCKATISLRSTGKYHPDILSSEEGRTCRLITCCRGHHLTGDARLEFFEMRGVSQREIAATAGYQLTIAMLNLVKVDTRLIYLIPQNLIRT